MTYSPETIEQAEKLMMQFKHFVNDKDVDGWAKYSIEDKNSASCAIEALIYHIKNISYMQPEKQIKYDAQIDYLKHTYNV